MSIELIRAFLLKSKASNRQTFLNDLFKSMDKDHSRKVDYSEFKQGLRNLGLRDLVESEFRNLFNQFDVSKDGKIDYHEFVSVLKPGLSPVRIKAIDDAFRKLDVNGDGVLSIEDFRVIYMEQARRHPKCLDGSWTVEQALQSFLDAFDTPGQNDGIVTRDEFKNYYSIISATIPDDAYFVFLMNSCFDSSLISKSKKN